MNELPYISSMIVMRNEAEYVSECLLSLLIQDYPKDRYEIIIIDGESEDESVLTVKKIRDEFYSKQKEKKPIIRILKNKNKLLATGWNIGIKESLGEYVVRIDAHSYVDKSFIKNSVETMLSIGDAVCVGGLMCTEAVIEKGKIIADILSSPFGVGNAKFRYSLNAGYVDTVAYGLYRKSIFNQVGLFDEKLIRNQDCNMHGRIRKAGGKFYLNPEIKSIYHPRDTITKMIKQGYQNGMWNLLVFKKDKNSLSIRHLIPMVFVISIILSVIAGFIYKPIWILLIIEIILHLILGCVYACKKTKKIRSIIKMPFLFIFLHLAYGTGSIIGAVRKQ